MEIHALKLLVTEQDINQMASRFLEQAPQVKNLDVRLAPEGVQISGVYQMVMGIRFQTLWELSVQDGKVAAHLAQFKVSGLGGGMLRAAFMGALTAAVKQEDALQIQGDTLFLDPDRLLTKQGVPARFNLTRVQCQPGSLWIESSAPVA
jgi:hypothetical protein